MEIKAEYLVKAKKLNKTGFAIYGIGNFDITIEEIAYLLQLIDENNFKEIKIFYKKLVEVKL